MKFIVMTSQGLENNFADELIKSNLFPEMIVTDNPFYCGKINPFKFIIKKGLLIIRYLTRRNEIRRRYQAYFLARHYGIPLWPSPEVNSDRLAGLIKEMGVDYAFVFAFGILKEKIFSAPRYGCINFHPSLLPLNRGASPFNWTILNNRYKTGITFHSVTKVIDGGPIIEQYEIPLSGYETAKILNEYLFSIGAVLFVRLILRLEHNYQFNLAPNVISGGTYEPPFGKEHTFISETKTFEEISSLISASRFNKSYAVYVYSGTEYQVLNCVDLTSCELPGDDFPFRDDKENIYIKSADNIIVYLVTQHFTRENIIKRIYGRLARYIGPFSIFFALCGGAKF